MDSTVSTIKSNENDVEIKFSNGETKKYDYIVGCDGVHSNIRNSIFHKSDFEHYREWRTWYFWADKKFTPRHTITTYTDPQRLVSIFDEGDKSLCTLFAPVSHKNWDEEETRIERLNKTFGNFTSVFPEILNGINATDIVPTDLTIIKLKKWHEGRVVLLGDAAHAMEPYAALGASMAMEDAYVLSGELLKIKNGLAYEQAFNDYEKKRRLRVKDAKKTNWYLELLIAKKSRTINTAVKFACKVIPMQLLTKNLRKILKKDI